MGFLDGLGRVAGTVAGNLKEIGEQTKVFKTEYRSWTNEQLISEYRKWHGKGDRESLCRISAVSQLLKARGYDVNDL